MAWNNRITLARERLGINKSEFARRVGVSTATTADWESGVIKMIDGMNLVKVASILKVTPEWLITGSGEEKNDADINSVVVEFAWVYRNATAEGKSFLRNTVKVAAQTFVAEALDG